MEGNRTGVCRFCGQSVMVEAMGGETQEELDQLATDKCMCPDAQTERRREARKAKIEAYIEKHFIDGDIKNFVKVALELVEKSRIGATTFALDEERTVKIWVDSDAYLHIKVKKTEDEELKV